MVAWHAVVLEMSLYYATKPTAHGRDGVVQASSEFAFDLS